MGRLAAAAAVAALIGVMGSAGAAPNFSAPPPREDSAPPRDMRRWTEPAGTFRVDLPKGWDQIDTASLPNAPVLQIVITAKIGQCWFTRIPREATARVAPSELIAARAAPLDAPTWEQLAKDQHVLQGQAGLMESQVESIGGWPVQTAWLRGANGDVFAALHARPGLDIWGFCAASDKKDHRAELTAIARSVTTPRDPGWARLMAPQASLTAVP